MPERHSLGLAEVIWQDYPNYPVKSAKVQSLGQYQYISALNNTGMYVAGKLRMNPVVILKSMCLSSAASPVPVKSGRDTLTVRGDIASWLDSTDAWALTPASGGNKVPTIGSNLSSHLTWDDMMSSYSLTKALSKANEPALDLGMVIGEMRETLEGLLNPLSALRKYGHQLKDGLGYIIKRGGRKAQPLRLTDTFNMLSGSWLEWRYGIMPVILTVEAAIEHFAGLNKILNGKLLRASGTVKTKYSRQYVVARDYQNWSFRGQRDIIVKKKVCSKAYYTQCFPPTFAQKYGLDLSNLPSVAWELIPLSFVVDWFFGVGNWLGSLKALDYRTSLGTTTSQKTTITMKTRVDKMVCGYVPSGIDSAQSSTSTLTLEMLERRVNLTPPPLPVVNSGALSLKRQIDALSLSWQRMPKIRS